MKRFQSWGAFVSDMNKNESARPLYFLQTAIFQAITAQQPKHEDLERFGLPLCSQQSLRKYLTTLVHMSLQPQIGNIVPMIPHQHLCITLRQT